MLARHGTRGKPMKTAIVTALARHRSRYRHGVFGPRLQRGRKLAKHHQIACV